MNYVNKKYLNEYYFNQKYINHYLYLHVIFDDFTYKKPKENIFLEFFNLKNLKWHL